MLRPLVSFKGGFESSRSAFEDVAVELGFTRAEGSRAYDIGIQQYQRFLAAYRELGRKILREVEENPDRVYIALLGRPYVMDGIIAKGDRMGRKIGFPTINLKPENELYPRDGVYAGAVGYLDYGGDMDTCIAIRTLVVKGRDAWLQAGAGIVADSQPDFEYKESVNKARAVLRAVRRAEAAKGVSGS